MNVFTVLIVLALAFGGAAGAGPLAESPYYRNTVTCPGTPVFGDLNGDGAADMAVTSAGKGWNTAETTVQIFFNTAGSFPAEPDVRVPLPGCYALALHDIDGNGRNDIGAVVGRALMFLLNANRFEPQDALKYFNTNQGNGPVQFYDGDSPSVFYALRGPTLRRFTRRQDLFAVGNGYICGPRINDNADAVAVDIDGDGTMDIVTRARNEAEIRIYYGPILNITVTPDELSDFLALKVPGALAGFGIADLNHDGLPDLVAADSKNQQTHLYFQDRPVGFDADAAPSVSLAVPGRIYTADIDNDTRTDLLILSGSDKVFVFLQKQDGAWPTTGDAADQVVRLPVKCQGLALADLNGDGFLELVARGSQNGILIFQGTGGAEQP
jgi:hypothetical protein